MDKFKLTIVTTDGMKFDGEVESVSVRSTQGAVEILAHHMDYVTTLGMGPACIGFGDSKRLAACIGGMLSMNENVARLIASSFEWADEIDQDRAQKALKRADEKLARTDLPQADRQLAKAARQRALVRISVANAK